jgi:hypothetical protein
VKPKVTVSAALADRTGVAELNPARPGDLWDI